MRRIALGGLARAEYGSLASLCIGFGCYLAYYPVGTLGTPCVTLFAGSDLSVVVARSVYFGALVLAMAVLKAVQADRSLCRGPYTVLPFVGINLAFVSLFAADALGLRDAGLFAFSAVLGVSTAAPVLGWYEGFLNLHRTRGKAACIIALAGCSIVSVLVMPVLLLLNRGLLLLPALLVPVNASWACYIHAARALRRGDAEGQEPSKGVAGAEDATVREYRPSVYIRVVMTTSGFVWFMSYSLAAHIGFGRGFDDPNTWGIFWAGIVVDAAIIAIFLPCAPASRMRFGMLLRCIVAITGAVWAFMPLIVQAAPAVGSFFCAMTYLLLITNMVLLTVELCLEHGLSVCSVCASNYLLYIVGGTVGTVVFSCIVAFSDAWVTDTLVSAFCISALLASLPFLPSMGSSATDLACSRLPEVERIEDRIALEKEALIMANGITERETEIMDLLLAGYSRGSIAERLSLSPHTVKNHVTSIYRKLGVHSNHELAALILGLEERNGR